ncbi:hypothetical protein R6Q59_002314 [Mikania micrantha]
MLQSKVQPPIVAEVQSPTGSGARGAARGGGASGGASARLLDVDDDGRLGRVGFGFIRYMIIGSGFTSSDLNSETIWVDLGL